jgi:hypothetical protein
MFYYFLAIQTIIMYIVLVFVAVKLSMVLLEYLDEELSNIEFTKENLIILMTKIKNFRFTVIKEKISTFYKDTRDGLKMSIKRLKFIESIYEIIHTDHKETDLPYNIEK